MTLFELGTILMLLSIILIATLTVCIVMMHRKGQLYYACLTLTTSMLLINCSVLVEMFSTGAEWYRSILDISFYIGYIMLPVSILFIGLIYAKTRIEFTWKYWLVFIVPTISILVLLTNDYHHLLYVVRSIYPSKDIRGPYFTVHAVYSYICILIGLWYLLYFSIKNTGVSSRQALLIIAGITVPVIANIISTFHLTSWPIYVENTTFSFGVVCWILAIFRFKFLNVLPLAMDKVVDLISDSFVVLNERLEIVDFNKTLVNNFNKMIKIERQVYFGDALKESPELEKHADKFIDIIMTSIQSKKPINFEKQFFENNLNKCFSIEITPVFSGKTNIATILFFKDISEQKKNIVLLKQKQDQLVEKERLASLGQLISGLSHNLKTPIMSIAGYIEGLLDLVKEYDESIEDKEVTAADHHDIAKEMTVWLEKTQEQLGYMSDNITSVREQAVQLNDNSTRSFTIYELIKTIQPYIRYELQNNNCNLDIENEADETITLKGEVHNLVQVIYNLIKNSIYSYQNKGGDIELRIKKEDNNINIMIKDYGCGIESEIKDKLFKEMVTTKGKNGSGLGLYMSYSTVKGRFNG
ncbi:MAG: histidine kinase N-terminal 7TM domain-containing protein, partial [Bacteroidota bacterium]|nr:histidine kinase N-terminal 7TM domain-containing protein [Bacteroidota bacterium]